MRGRQWHNESSAGPSILSESTIIVCLLVIAVALWTYPVLALMGVLS